MGFIDKINYMIKTYDKKLSKLEWKTRLWNYDEYKLFENKVIEWYKGYDCKGIKNSKVEFERFYLNNELFVNNLLDIGIKNISKEIEKSTTKPEIIKEYMLYVKIFFRFVGTLNEIIAKQVLEFYGWKVERTDRELDTKYGIDFKYNDIYISVKSKKPYGRLYVILDKQLIKFKKEVSEKVLKLYSTTSKNTITIVNGKREYVLDKTIKTIVSKTPR